MYKQRSRGNSNWLKTTRSLFLFFLFFFKPLGTALDRGLAHMHFVDYLNSTSFNRVRDATLQNCWHEWHQGSCRADGMEGVVAASSERSRIVTGTTVSHTVPFFSFKIAPLYRRTTTIQFVQVCYSFFCFCFSGTKVSIPAVNRQEDWKARISIFDKNI